MYFIRSAFLTFVILLLSSPMALSKLGNTPTENNDLYQTAGYKPKYHHGGPKNITIYRKDNRNIAVVYRDGISILETISYINAIERSEADSDISTFIIPDPQEKPSFKSQMLFVKGDAIEYIFKNGIRTKMLLDENGKVTDIMSSMNCINQTPAKEPTNETPPQE